MELVSEDVCGRKRGSGTHTHSCSHAAALKLEISKYSEYFEEYIFLRSTKYSVGSSVDIWKTIAK